MAEVREYIKDKIMELDWKYDEGRITPEEYGRKIDELFERLEELGGAE